VTRDFLARALFGALATSGFAMPAFAQDDPAKLARKLSNLAARG
jgi:hypothetical protein